MEINDLSTATRKVVETARESLVIGSLQPPRNARESAP
jgi:hypothetical protein